MPPLPRRPIALDTPTDVCGVRVTAIDANHCPGAAMLHFALADGRQVPHTIEPPSPPSVRHHALRVSPQVLHTGDFRYQHAMASHPALGAKLSALYLDTTCVT